MDGDHVGTAELSAMPSPTTGRRRLSTLRTAVSLVFGSGRELMVAIIVATVVTSFAVAGTLLVGRTILDMLTDSERVSGRELAPYLVTLGALLLVSGISQTIAGELRLPLSERVQRRATDEILDVATEVDLEAFETSDFHDRLQRAACRRRPSSRQRSSSASSPSFPRWSSRSASSR